MRRRDRTKRERQRAGKAALKEIAGTLTMFGHWIDDWLAGQSDGGPMFADVECAAQDYRHAVHDFEATEGD